MGCGGNCACACKAEMPMCKGDGNCARPDCPCKQKKADAGSDAAPKAEVESGADTEKTNE